MSRAAACVAVLAMLPLGAARPDDRPLTVSAAVSLTDSLEAAAAIYRGEGGGPVRFNFAGSNTLARQLVNGAPADLFISADEAQMDVAAAAGAIDRTTRVDLVANRLAVIARPDLAALRDIRGLLRPDVRRVAIGDPAAVPAGVYARQYLQAIGLWEAMQSRLVPVGNVRAALAAVENGSVDAGLVYETDAAMASRAGTAFVISGEGAPRIVYPAAIVTVSRNREASARFLRFLQGPKAAELFRQHHFSPITR
jgi:molybdate transport system substrate-binding protein